MADRLRELAAEFQAKGVSEGDQHSDDNAETASRPSAAEEEFLKGQSREP